MVYTESAQEVASHFNVSARTITRLAEQDKIPHIRVGNQYRFNKDEVFETLKHKAPCCPKGDE